MSRIIIEKDIDGPMRDGCVLKADLYRPEGPEKMPVLLNRTPYDKSFPQITRPPRDQLARALGGFVAHLDIDFLLAEGSKSSHRSPPSAPG